MVEAESKMIDDSLCIASEIVEVEALLESILRGHRYVLLITPRNWALRLRMNPSDMQADEIMQMLREELEMNCEAAGCLSCPDCDPEFFGSDLEPAMREVRREPIHRAD
jgi:hypothetical protein